MPPCPFLTPASSIIMIFTMFIIISSNYTKNKQLIADKKQENITILVTLLICIITRVYAIYSGSQDNNIKLNYGLLFLIAIFERLTELWQVTPIIFFLRIFLASINFISF